MIYLVYREEQDSISGFDFTGIFDNKTAAQNFAESEGPGYKVFETTFGPIDWMKLDPPAPEIKIDWGNF